MTYINIKFFVKQIICTDYTVRRSVFLQQIHTNSTMNCIFAPCPLPGFNNCFTFIGLKKPCCPHDVLSLRIQPRRSHSGLDLWGAQGCSSPNGWTGRRLATTSRGLRRLRSEICTTCSAQYGPPWPSKTPKKTKVAVSPSLIFTQLQRAESTFSTHATSYKKARHRRPHFLHGFFICSSWQSMQRNPKRHAHWWATWAYPRGNPRKSPCLAQSSKFADLPPTILRNVQRMDLRVLLLEAIKLAKRRFLNCWIVS